MTDLKQPGPDPASGETEDWRRPLSDAPVHERSDGHGNIIRTDSQNRRLCHARRRDGELCKSPAVVGMRVCRVHGGSSQRAKNSARMRLTELVAPAIATLAREMAQADKSADRQRAANSILDRGGFGRQQKVDVTDAKELLVQRILDMKAADDGAEIPENEGDNE